MIRKLVWRARRLLSGTLRKWFNFLPRESRFAVYRNFVDCDPAPDERLVLKIAETQEELEACFTLLHDAYVGSKFMRPDPSGMRVTIYHALPTTTTLCAKYDGEVVGTLSLIRESVLGFPLQRIFDLTALREKKGNIAEVSALAIDRRFRRTGGTILFPLMKFMYEYCTTFFDTRHLVIAVNPGHIEMYESLLFFKRLTQNVVENYDFVNGAPAVGATLDLTTAQEIFRKHYSSKPPKRNLYAFFTEVKLPNIHLPPRRFFTTNDPVLTPELLDYFFNVRTSVFSQLSDRKKCLLHTIYDLPAYRDVLRAISEDTQDDTGRRRHRRFSVRCPARFSIRESDGTENKVDLEVVQLSRYGFQAHALKTVPINVWGEMRIQLGPSEVSRIKVAASRGSETGVYGFRMGEPDLIWRKFVNALYRGSTQADLEDATRFMTDR
ncbi:MAG: GNAT family N-acetyltransferase [Candidatus Accumulibacter sp.]|uniref:GNAT family N-acetyltransferase n=1 Tax=Candidatus Accumulibacter proximus TaxID=2954385 RepID=A0A935PVC7_9PROT|nr:GNAT family N-acetyltransferase [Candidatus Accumulibacter proximus]